MLVTAEEMLKKAKAGKYAVGQFNINNLEWTKAILATAQELQSPVIPVSYTHLDVYKRQIHACRLKSRQRRCVSFSTYTTVLDH